MPKGVEHKIMISDAHQAMIAKGSVMPKGVEHNHDDGGGDRDGQRRKDQ